VNIDKAVEAARAMKASNRKRYTSEEVAPVIEALLELANPVEITRSFESDGFMVAEHEGCGQIIYPEYDRPEYCPNCGRKLIWS
jgi:hypothetical protein